MYGRNTYGDHRIFINNTEILGVTDFNGNFEVPFEFQKILGDCYGGNEKQGEDIKNISITKYLVPNDSLRYFTGIQPCNGMLIYKGKNFSFENAYLTNYSMSCEAGEISTVQTEFNIYGRIGGNFQNTLTNLPNQPLTLDVAHFGNIHLQTSEGDTNRIVSFDISINCERVPGYVLGSEYPSEIYLNKPLNIDLIIGIEIDDYECNNTQTILCGSPKDIFLNLKNCNNTSIIESFLIPNAKLISEDLSVGLNNASKVELTYKSYIY